MKKISDHITYAEAVKSATAERKDIVNVPGPLEIVRMKRIANAVFEPIRAKFCLPISVTSFFRSVELNKKLGGSKNSQHCKGEAMDLDAHVYGGLTNADIFHYIKDNLEFDQLIWEYGDDNEPAWVHVSYTKRYCNRKQILRAVKVKNWRGKYVTKYQYYA